MQDGKAVDGSNFGVPGRTWRSELAGSGGRISGGSSEDCGRDQEPRDGRRREFFFNDGSPRVWTPYIFNRFRMCGQINGGTRQSAAFAELFSHVGIVASVWLIERSTLTCPQLIVVKPISKKKWELTDEGRYITEHGSHEAVVYNAVPDKGISQAELVRSSPHAKVGFSKAMVAGWIELDKSGNVPTVRRKAPSIVDVIQTHLKNLANVPESVKAEYKKRKLLQEM